MLLLLFLLLLLPPALLPALLPLAVVWHISPHPPNSKLHHLRCSQLSACLQQQQQQRQFNP